MRSISLARLHDGLDQLSGEHRAIRQLFRAFERAASQGRSGHAEKAVIVDQLCDTLMLHARVEEEIFYPVVRSVLSAGTNPTNAFCNHQRLFDLIAWVDELEPNHRDYDRVVRLIGECVVPSMDQEQAVLFQAVRAAGLDTLALGQRMANFRKAHLRGLTEINERHGGSEEAITAWTASVPLRAFAPSANPF